LGATVKAAEQKLASLRDEFGRPPGLIAWSYGARLALELVLRDPTITDHVVFLAPTLDLRVAFCRLAQHLIHRGLGGEVLPAAVRALTDGGGHADFMKLVGVMLAMPDLMAHYWGQGARCSAEERVVVEADFLQGFDMPTFVSVSREECERPTLRQPDFSGVVRILLGRNDPYCNVQEDEVLWRSLFPQASLSVEDCGHLMMYELAPEAWLPSCPIESGKHP
jgi:pimeloyl-ACP methyl ester carboxylesterase